MRRRRRAPARTGHERESQREVVDYDDDGDGDDDESDLDWEEDFLPPPAFDKSCLEWAVSQATGSRNVPSRVAAGLDYLLRALLYGTVIMPLLAAAHAATHRCRSPTRLLAAALLA